MKQKIKNSESNGKIRGFEKWGARHEKKMKLRLKIWEWMCVIHSLGPRTK